MQCPWVIASPSAEGDGRVAVEALVAVAAVRVALAALDPPATPPQVAPGTYVQGRVADHGEDVVEAASVAQLLEGTAGALGTGHLHLGHDRASVDARGRPDWKIV